MQSFSDVQEFSLQKKQKMVELQIGSVKSMRHYDTGIA